jgi:hypothetical protein
MEFQPSVHYATSLIGVCDTTLLQPPITLQPIHPHRRWLHMNKSRTSLTASLRPANPQGAAKQSCRSSCESEIPFVPLAIVRCRHSGERRVNLQILMPHISFPSCYRKPYLQELWCIRDVTHTFANDLILELSNEFSVNITKPKYHSKPIYPPFL